MLIEEKDIEKTLKKSNTCPIRLGDESVEKVVHNIFIYHEKKAFYQKKLMLLEREQKQQEFLEYQNLGKQFGTNKDREISAKSCKKVKELDHKISECIYYIEVYRGLISQTETACQLYRTQQASNRSQQATYSKLG